MSQEESKRINDALNYNKDIPEYELEETETKNRQCIKKLSRILKHLQKNRSGLNTGCRRKDLDEAYESFFFMYRDKIGHYFRVIYIFCVHSSQSMNLICFSIIQLAYMVRKKCCH